MRILLLNPPFLPRYSRQSRSPCVSKGGTFYLPYYLAYAAGALEKSGFSDIKLMDAIAKNWSRKETINFIKSFNPDLIIVDTSTPSIHNDVEVAAEIKKALPNSHVNLVGTHLTRKTEETFGLSEAIDSICRGEYDFTLVELAEAIESEKPLREIEGLSFREDGKIFHNPERPLLTSKELDELPFVSEVYKKHLNIWDYFYASLLYPQVTILTARGCPFSCSFCNIPFKNSYRPRSPENVVDEFEYIQDELPEVREVMIEDDTFPVSKRRTIEISDLLIKRKIKISWSCNARVDTDYETLKRMKDAGCRLLCVGFESPVQKTLNTVHKKTTARMQLEFMKNCNKLGLLVNGCFILGLPGDTEETIKETIEFAKKLNPDTVQFYPLFLYPGTEAWDWAEENGYLASKDYSALLTREGKHLSNADLPGLNHLRATYLCDKALREFYLRPKYIFYKLFQILSNLGEAQRTFLSAKIFFKNLISPSVQQASL
ncbi:MAG: radical SAM protein [Candidatus Aenigmarchaeota archaeon]|nr:radical SAM protein [Candidatus Aenigmarchaeota archaeon]